MAIGATAYETSRKIEPSASKTERAGHYAFAGGKALWEATTEHPLLEGTANIKDAFKSEGTIQKKAGQMVGSFVPTILSDIATATDSSDRVAEGFGAQIGKRIPGVRRLLPPDPTAEHRRSWAIDPLQMREARDGAGSTSAPPRRLTKPENPAKQIKKDLRPPSIR